MCSYKLSLGYCSVRLLITTLAGSTEIAIMYVSLLFVKYKNAIDEATYVHDMKSCRLKLDRRYFIFLYMNKGETFVYVTHVLS